MESVGLSAQHTVSAEEMVAIVIWKKVVLLLKAILCSRSVSRLGLSGLLLSDTWSGYGKNK